MARRGALKRIRGGAELVRTGLPSPARMPLHLSGVPFHENIGRNTRQKEAIGRAAAALCRPGEGVMIDGGSTTLQMCPHLGALNLQVLTNSLHIVSALLNQPATRILVPAGSVFREQNIILSADGEESMPRFHAPRLFMGAAALGPQGLMQADVVLVAAERRLIDKADEIIVLVDSSKFTGPSGHVVCGLEEIDAVITDAGIADDQRRMLEQAGVKLIIAK
jgi:DeoR family ulaG and ulaABCDEF operon transcriptional repressor